MNSMLTAHRKLGLLALPFLAAAIFMLWPHTASAQYVENNLVDDTIFLNAASMSQSQVQSFLAGRGGYLATYVSWSDRDGANVPASQIIWEAAQDYGINPQVILATLQKEQSLVTAKNPVPSQLNYAMGYGCPDSSGCSGYTGLYNQVINGTWQLRYNFERARGNNTWWRDSSSYACNNSHAAPSSYYPNNDSNLFYSPGLYVGNHVTFYDGFGTAYKNFTINNAATAALYCYTPHAYPGSSADYYSGSYNFVTAFEQWFGSSQPSVAVSSGLRISTALGKVYSGAPTTASFDLTNNTTHTASVMVAVTVRDPNGNNLDYLLKTVTIAPNSTATYSDTKVLPIEGQYTFGITSFTDGVWDNNYPSSSNIDNPRLVTMNVQAIPTITTSPSSSVSDMRVGRLSNISFTVTNNSAQPISIGKIALAMRDPNGFNVDLPLVDPGVIAPAAQYTYSKPMTPQKVGLYTGYIVATNDGVAWDSQDFPALSSSTVRTVQFSVGPNPTLVTGPTLSLPTPKVGQNVTMSIGIKNYSESTVNVGYVGIAVRDPDNQNVDIGGVSLTALAPNSTYVFSGSRAFSKPGVYTAWVVSYVNNNWYDSVPISDSSSVQRKITFTVKPSPTLTQGLTVTGGSGLRVGDTVTGSFKVKNYGDMPVSVNKSLCFILRGNSKNYDLGCLNITTLQPGQELTYTGSRVLGDAGTYKAYFSMYDGSWHDNQTFDLATGTEPTTLSFTVKGSPTLTQGLTIINPSPHQGDTVTGTFKVMNHSSSAITVNKNLCYIVRDAQGRNNDFGCLNITTLQPGQELTYTGSHPFLAGSYRAYFSTYDGQYWHDNVSFDQETGVEPTTLSFTVLP